MKSEPSEGFEIAPRGAAREDQENPSNGSLACTRCNWYIDGEGWQEEEMSGTISFIGFFLNAFAPSGM